MMEAEARLNRFQGRTCFGDPLLRGCAPLFISRGTVVNWLIVVESRRAVPEFMDKTCEDAIFRHRPGNHAMDHVLPLHGRQHYPEVHAARGGRRLAARMRITMPRNDVP